MLGITSVPSGQSALRSASIRPRGPSSTGATFENAVCTISTPAGSTPSVRSCATRSSREIMLRVPPLRQVAGGAARLRLVVRDVVEQHQAGAHRRLEVDDVEAGGRLVEAIAVAARIESQQAG